MPHNQDAFYSTGSANDEPSSLSASKIAMPKSTENWRERDGEFSGYLSSTADDNFMHAAQVSPPSGNNVDLSQVIGTGIPTAEMSKIAKDKKKGKMFDYLSIKKDADDGTLTQDQANAIAQQIYSTKKQEASSKFTEGYVSPIGNWIAQLKKSGYEYQVKKLPASQMGMTLAAVPTELGVAVKIKTDSEKSEDVSTGFPTWGYIAVGITVVVVISGAVYYFKNKG